MNDVQLRVPTQVGLPSGIPTSTSNSEGESKKTIFHYLTSKTIYNDDKRHGADVRAV